MHEKMGLTHTDLKPENILLKMDTKKRVNETSLWPIQVQKKKHIYPDIDDDENDEESDDYEHFSEAQEQDGCTGGNVGNGHGFNDEIVTSAEELKKRRNRFKEKIWLRPLDD